VGIDVSSYSPDEPLDTILEGQFCGGKSHCIMKTLPELHAFVKLYMKSRFDLCTDIWPTFIKGSSVSGFWDVVRKHKSWCNRLTTEGWEPYDEECRHFEHGDSDESE